MAHATSARRGRHRAPHKTARMGLVSALTIGFAGGGFAAMTIPVGSAAPVDAAPSATFTSSINPAAPSLAKGTWVSANTDNPAGYTDPGALSYNGNVAHSFVSNNGDVGICAHDAKPSPATTTSGTKAPYVAYTKQRFVTGAYTGSEGSYSAEATEEMAYILSQSKWAVALNSPQAPLNYTAIDYASGVLGNNTAEHQLPSANGAQVKALANQMIDEAKKYHGPYKLTISADKENVALGQVVPISISVQTETGGVNVPGQSLTVTATNGTFDDGSTSKTITTTGEASTLKLKVTEAGVQPTVKVAASVAARGLWLQTNGSAQDIFKVGARENLAGSLALTAAKKQALNPTLTTLAKQDTKDVWDTGSGKDYPANQKITGYSDAYSVPNGTKITLGTKPANAKFLGRQSFTQTTDAHGNLSFTTGKLANPGPGYTVYWVEHTDAGQNGTHTWAAVNGTFGAAGESTSVEKPKPTPTPTPSTTPPAPKPSTSTPPAPKPTPSTTPPAPKPTPSTTPPAPKPTPKPHKPVPGPKVQTG